MPADRRGLRGVVLAEDKRTGSFLRRLLTALGYESRGFDFQIAPSGQGAAEAWVLANYPREVKVLRVKSDQRLGLIAVRDGDSEGVAARKMELEAALREAGLAPGTAGERIAIPVPTWSIENWLLALLGEEGINEERKPIPGKGPSWKQVFENTYSGGERNALKQAAKAWRDNVVKLPSLIDGHAELARLDL